MNYLLVMANNTANKSYPRSWHEASAIRCIVEAQRKSGGYGVKGLLEAHRLVGQARTHLVSIGLKDSKRTQRLWAVVCRADKAIQARCEKILVEKEIY